MPKEINIYQFEVDSQDVLPFVFLIYIHNKSNFDFNNKIGKQEPGNYFLIIYLQHPYSQRTKFTCFKIGESLSVAI